MNKRAWTAALVVTLLATGAAQANQIAGAVDANGTSQVNSTKYKVTHPGKGHYVITFTTAFPAPYATCMFMTIGAYHASGLIETTRSCDVTFVTGGGSLVNTLFNFIAVNTTP